MSLLGLFAGHSRPPEKSPAIAAAEHCRGLHLSGRVPNYEALLGEAYRKFLGRGDVVADVGANVGLHTRRFSRIVGPYGRVIAFEPLPHLVRQLRSLDLPNVQIRRLALSNYRGKSEFRHVVNGSGESGFRERRSFLADPIVEILTVRVTTLDDVLDRVPRLDYVKMDIEGGEIDCLQGARAVIAKHRPIISVEYGENGYTAFGHKSSALPEFARGAGYLLSDLFGNIVATDDDWGAIVDRSFWDYFLIPEERKSMLEAGLATLP